MAISKYTGTSTTDLTLFYNFLESHKSGTFLENMTITLNTTSSLTISDGTDTFTFTPKTYSSGDINIASYTNGYITNTIKGAYSSQATLYARFDKAMLCNNGLIISIYYNYRSGTSTLYANAYLVLTVDNAGKLAFVYFYNNDNNNGGVLAGVDVGFCVNSNNSTTTAMVMLVPNYNATLTSIAPIQPTTADNSSSLPFAYAAVHTQQAGVGLAAVTIDGTNYITNGRLYIKDE